MTFLIALLTVAMVLNCLLLILLVLIQLPKKEAGAGLAFGGGATDALFGAGSGNALTKITKYAAGSFFGLAIILSLLHSHVRKERTTLAFPTATKTEPSPQSTPVVPPSTPSPAAPPALATNTLMSVPVPVATNVPATTNQ